MLRALLGHPFHCQMEQRADAAAEHAGGHGQQQPAGQKRDPDRFLIMQEHSYYISI